MATGGKEKKHAHSDVSHCGARLREYQDYAVKEALTEEKEDVKNPFKGLWHLHRYAMTRWRQKGARLIDTGRIPKSIVVCPEKRAS